MNQGEVHMEWIQQEESDHKQKKVLITGNSGYLGKNLVSKLKQLNIQCYFSNTKDANLLEFDNLKVFNDVKFDYIFHLAAWTKAGDFCLHVPFTQWLINNKINNNIIEYWVKDQRQAAFIGIGTSCSYDPDLEMIEENYLSGNLDKDLFAYALTKRSMLVALQAAQKQYNLNYLYFIPSTIYGPNFSNNDDHFIYDLVRKIKSAKQKNSKAILWGTGEQTRDLIYIDDLCNAIIKASIEKNLKNTILNISSNESFSIKQYAQKICDILEINFDDYIEFDKNAFMGVMNKKLNIEKAKKLELLENITLFETGILKLLR